MGKPVATAEAELVRLDARWLYLHLYTTALIAAGALVVELVMYLWLKSSDMMASGLVRYLVKYVAAPGCANALMLLSGLAVVHAPRIPRGQKACLISLIMTLVCTVLYVVHSIFEIIILIYALPVLMSVLYERRRLTTLIWLLCMSLAIGGRFIPWDPGNKLTAKTFQNLTVGLVLLNGVYVACMAIIHYMKKKRQLIRRQDAENLLLQQQMLMDPLTGVGNRAALREGLDRLTGQALPCHMVMMDIDGFKGLNDSQGHLYGDRVLETLGRLLTEMAACYDMAPYRYGGDEFLLLFFQCAASEAEQALRGAQRALARSFGAGVTFSAGLVACVCEAEPLRALRQADEALYRAKELGGGKISPAPYAKEETPCA